MRNGYAVCDPQGGGARWRRCGPTPDTAIDLKATGEGRAPLPVEGKVYAAIYRVEGDALTVCVPNGEARPTGFEAPAGSGRRLRVFRRVKADE